MNLYVGLKDDSPLVEHDATRSPIPVTWAEVTDYELLTRAPVSIDLGAESDVVLTVPFEMTGEAKVGGVFLTVASDKSDTPQTALAVSDFLCPRSLVPEDRLEATIRLPRELVKHLRRRMGVHRRGISAIGKLGKTGD